MPIRLPLDDWDAVTSELREFGASGDVTTGEDSLRIDFGTARVEVSRHGHVSTGMPLHDFEHDGGVTVVVDHEDGALRIETDDVEYTFRRPTG